MSAWWLVLAAISGGVATFVGIQLHGRDRCEELRSRVPVICFPSKEQSGCYDGERYRWLEPETFNVVRVRSRDGYYDKFVVGWEEEKLP